MNVNDAFPEKSYLNEINYLIRSKKIVSPDNLEILIKEVQENILNLQERIKELEFELKELQIKCDE